MGLSFRRRHEAGVLGQAGESPCKGWYKTRATLSKFAHKQQRKKRACYRFPAEGTRHYQAGWRGKAARCRPMGSVQ